MDNKKLLAIDFLVKVLTAIKDEKSVKDLIKDAGSEEQLTTYLFGKSSSNIDEISDIVNSAIAVLLTMTTYTASVGVGVMIKKGKINDPILIIQFLSGIADMFKDAIVRDGLDSVTKSLKTVSGLGNGSEENKSDA